MFLFLCGFPSGKRNIIMKDKIRKKETWNDLNINLDAKKLRELSESGMTIKEFKKRYKIK